MDSRLSTHVSMAAYSHIRKCLGYLYQEPDFQICKNTRRPSCSIHQNLHTQTLFVNKT